MHAEGRVPARGVRHLDRGDRRAVLAKIVRTGADPGAPLLNCLVQVPPAAIGARCSASGIPLPRPRRERAPAHRPKPRRPCAISAFAANKPPIPPPTITTWVATAPSSLLAINAAEVPAAMISSHQTEAAAPIANDTAISGRIWNARPIHAMLLFRRAYATVSALFSLYPHPRSGRRGPKTIRTTP